MHSAATVRCAVYTRKSTEEGLEQAFNSLDAQREACEAFIASQRHEGWALVPDAYDDGGFSGGNLQRPGLQQLLEDVRSGKVDVIVVYKIDRLTRSLADFSRIVDVLDAQKASFVSVTQAFNTTTSMGRLTLNVLLSFAQFEREVTGERIRDKIAASKRKGMWMGGPVPLGYEVKDRKLLVVQREAEVVRHVFAEYLRLRSVPALVVELARQGVQTKPGGAGRARQAGGAFQRGGLYHLLRNRIYVGEVSHKETSYPGEHEAIVDRAMFDAAAEQLKRDIAKRVARPDADHPSLLAGLLYDQQGRRMSPTHASRGDRRYRYYITFGMPAGADQPPVRLTAASIERALISRLTSFLGSPSEVHGALGAQADASNVQSALDAATMFTRQLDAAADRMAAIQALVARADLRDGQLTIALRRSALGIEGSESIIELTAAFEPALRHPHVKLVFNASGQARAAEPDADLIDLLREAHQVKDTLFAGGGSVAAVAARLGRCRKHLAKLARLAFLAPDIVTAIFDGRQPPSLTRTALLNAGELPHCWEEQRRLLGFA